MWSQNITPRVFHNHKGGQICLKMEEPGRYLLNLMRTKLEIQDSIPCPQQVSLTVSRKPGHSLRILFKIEGIVLQKSVRS